MTVAQRRLPRVVFGHNFSPTPSTASTLKSAASETGLRPTGPHEVAAFHQDNSKNSNDLVQKVANILKCLEITAFVSAQG